MVTKHAPDVTESWKMMMCHLQCELRNWSGFLIIIDPEKSDIAKELKIELPGEYALRVR